MAIPQDLLDKLNTAETLLETASDKDAAHATTSAALAAATTADTQAGADALSAHQAANTAASDAVAAIKAYFGV